MLPSWCALDFNWNAVMRVCIPSGMITARATPTKSPAPITDTRWRLFSLIEMNNGTDPARYEPNNITTENITIWRKLSIFQFWYDTLTVLLKYKWILFSLFLFLLPRYEDKGIITLVNTCYNKYFGDCIYYFQLILLSDK